jgi:hypothetical protein
VAEIASAVNGADTAKVEWQWGVKIPLRDGVRLNATNDPLDGLEAVQLQAAHREKSFHGYTAEMA